MWRGAAALLVLAALAGRARAEAPVPAAPPAPAVTPIPTPEILQRADETASRLRELLAQSSTDPDVEQVQAGLARVTADLRVLERDPAAQASAAVTLRDLEEIERRWLPLRETLAQWTALLLQRAQALDGALAELRRLDAVWEATERAAAQDRVPEVVRQRVRAIGAGVRETTDALRARRGVILTLQGTLAQLSATVAEQLAAVDATAARLRRRLLAPERPPLWRSLGAAAEEAEGAVSVPEVWQRRRGELVDYVRANPSAVATHGLILLVLLLAALWACRRLRGWALEDPALEAVVHLRDRPVAAAVLVSLLLTRLIHPSAPTVLFTVTKIVTAVPVLRLLRVGLFAALPSVPVGLALVLVVDAARNLLAPFSVPGRLFLLGEDVVIAAWLLWFLRPARLGRLRTRERRRRVVGLLGRLAFGLLGTAVVADVIGNVSLAVLLTDGTVTALYAAVVLQVAVQVLDGVFAAFLTSRWGRSLRTVQQYGPEVRRRGTAVIHAAFLAGWVVLTLYVFSALGAAAAALRALLEAHLAVGLLDISLGDVLALAVTIWLSFVVARLARVALQEDVLPRVSLPRGVPQAISTGASYTIVLLGFLAGLSAAGVDFGRITVLLGAFGVGLSFGLQNVVNNFVSGLILVVERPFQIGDTIEIEQVTGQVQNIGIRSSTIRTADGAEVIVPNGTLLSQKVANWTLADRRRRVEVRLRVAYGVDPAQVLGLLLGVAQAHGDVLRHPAPAALFLGFGDRGLEFVLYAWTARPDTLGKVRSDLGVAVYGALRAQGLQIPA